MENVNTGSHKCLAIEKNGAHLLLHSQRKFLSMSIPLALVIKLVIRSPSWKCSSRHFQTATSMLGLRLSYLVCWLFKGGDLVFYCPSVLLESSPLVFKDPGIKPHWFSKPDIMGTLLPSASPQGQGYLVWSLMSLILHACDVPPICGSSHWRFGPQPHLHSTITFKVAFSPWLAAEDLFYKAAGCFQGELQYMSCFLAVSMGGVEFSVFLLHHLPSQQPLISWFLMSIYICVTKMSLKV